MQYSFKTSRQKSYGRGAKQFSKRTRSNNKQKNTIDPSKYTKAAEVMADTPEYVAKNQFADFKIDQRIKANIVACKYITPSPIQDQSIEPILEGKDLVGTAQTGTGKTAAFLIPLIDQSLRNPKQRNLIIVPTRELATQIDDELRKFARGLKMYSAICIGGANIRYQMKILGQDPRFVIATPGRLKDLQERRILNLSRFNAIVLDEVDRMLDMGFVHEITAIIAQLPKDRQSLFFSATLSEPIKKIMQTFLQDPIYVQIDSNNSASNVSQNIVHIEKSEDKVEKLHELLSKEDFGKVLVFARTKYGADKLSKKLYDKGHLVDAIHGDKSQPKREQVLRKFKNDNLKVLVATDVAARGIDVKNITHVINFDEPQNYEDYIHRIGRTGRGGQAGNALTFVER